MRGGLLPPRSDGEARPGSARGAEPLPLPQIRLRVDWLALVPVGDLAVPDLEVEMWPVAGAGAADLADDLPGPDLVAGAEGGGLEHVQVDVAAVVRRAVGHQGVPAAVRVEALAAATVEDDPIADGEQGGSGLGEDVLSLVGVPVAVGAELGRRLAVIVRRGAADREDVPAGQPRCGPRADAEEGRAPHRRALARARVETGNGKPEQRSECGRQAEDDADRDPRLRGGPDEVAAADGPSVPGDSHRARSD